VKPLALVDILNLHEYELARPGFRQQVIESKQRRRIALGPLMTLVFENRDTVQFQIQEMLRVERIVLADKVEDEIRVYNDLLPGPGEVAATLFIEITDASQVQPVLDSFVGLDEPGKLGLVAGDKTFPARFTPGQSREDRISAVHYIRFELGEEGRRALASGEKAALHVRHGDYEARAALPRETVTELLRDLED
jgi:uncharacterized protein DUF3501